ncbi:hypothetical protein CLOM_g14862 [Closterium sp. NIES-68]|nr:hypothetical protein CLOM_g14862 [Closterium sp. NIES-68]GJP62011.1 hypothetical protein CLOP_g19117 [Closterium sp. NIES-67]
MGQGPSRPDWQHQETAHGTTNGILTGCDVLRAESFKRVQGCKVGLIANATSVLRDLTHLADAMHACATTNSPSPFQLVAIFGPEHGLRGTAQAGKSESASKDPKTGLPIFDLYSKNPPAIAKCFEASGADTIVFDIQDVGARFYTFIWTLYDCLVAAALSSSVRRFLVLDRPNPLGGVVVDGPITEPQHASFVGRKAIPLRHGMTVGELARLFLSEFLPSDAHLSHVRASGPVATSQTSTRKSSSPTFSPPFKLEVVEMAGWTRSSFPFFPYPQPFLLPPALPSPSTVSLSAPPPSPSVTPLPPPPPLPPSPSLTPLPVANHQPSLSREALPSPPTATPSTVSAILTSAAPAATVRTALQPLLWVPPSPNMPTPVTALVYAGTCLVEGTNLSEGRGTTLPFQLIGAPFMDHRFAEAVRNQLCPGCAIREAFFSPVAGKYSEKQVCGIESIQASKRSS